MNKSKSFMWIIFIAVLFATGIIFYKFVLLKRPAFPTEKATVISQTYDIDNIDGFSDGLTNPDSIIKYDLNEFETGIAEKSIYYIDINNDGTKDKITKTFIETGNAHAYYEYKIELKTGDKYIDVTPKNFRTTNGASCDLQQIKFSFKPKFKVTIISRAMGDLWNTPTMAYKQTFALSSDNKIQVSQKTQMRAVCDVKELF